MEVDMIDIAFALEGRTLPPDYRHALADALDTALPWLRDEPESGVHHLNLVRSGSQALVSPRTRLTLRVPRSRGDAACALAGTELRLGGNVVRVVRPQRRELLPHGTLYAHLVAAEETGEDVFLRRMRSELDALGVRGEPVCGRWQSAEAGRLAGCSLMLSGLPREQSLQVLQRGLGAHRRLGCGLFVPHKSAAAVGAPD
jgi:CRISPR-associated protein Cas6